MYNPIVNTKVLIILLIILAVGLGSYFLGRNQANLPQIAQTSPAPDPATANWKIHSYNLYSIKVPTDWQRGGDDRNDFSQLVNFDPRTATQRGFNPDIDKGILKVEIYQIPTTEKLDDFLAKSGQGETGLLYTPYNPMRIILDGQPAIKDGSTIYVKDPKNTRLITIAFLLDFNNYTELQNQIISTFKFTE